jgi:hypothetical protein
MHRGDPRAVGYAMGILHSGNRPTTQNKPGTWPRTLPVSPVEIHSRSHTAENGATMTCYATASRLPLTAAAAVCVAVATPSLQAQTAVSLTGIRYQTGGRDELPRRLGPRHRRGAPPALGCRWRRRRHALRPRILHDGRSIGALRQRRMALRGSAAIPHGSAAPPS